MSVMQSHSRRVPFGARSDSALFASEQAPKELVREFTDMVLPHESKTPRGAHPSSAMKRAIDRTRSGADHAVVKVLSFLWFRKQRGEAVETVVAGLHVAAARIAVDGVCSTELLPESQNETQWDSEEDKAQMALVADPNPLTARRYKEAAGAEIAAKNRMIAIADEIEARGR